MIQLGLLCMQKLYIQTDSVLCIHTHLVILAMDYYPCSWLLIASALVWGPESRIYSHKVRVFVHTWWDTLRNVMQNVVTYMHPTQSHRWSALRCVRGTGMHERALRWGEWAGCMRVHLDRRSDVVDCRWWHSFLPHQTALLRTFSYSKHDTSCTPHLHSHMTHMHSLRTGARQRSLFMSKLWIITFNLIPLPNTCDSEWNTAATVPIWNGSYYGYPNVALCTVSCVCKCTFCINLLSWPWIVLVLGYC